MRSEASRRCAFRAGWEWRYSSSGRTVRIALTLDSDVPAEENDYVRALTDAGVRRDELVVMRPGDPIEGEFDGVVIGGGDDVDPLRYGRNVLEGANVEIDHRRDAVDLPVFRSDEHT